MLLLHTLICMCAYMCVWKRQRETARRITLIKVHELLPHVKWSMNSTLLWHVHAQKYLYNGKSVSVEFQLQAALLDIHEIFFDTPLVEQMALIEQTRLNNLEKRLKSVSTVSVANFLCVCVCVCVCVCACCVCLCLCACMHVFMHVCVCVDVCVFYFGCETACVCVCLFCVCVPVPVCVSVFTCMCVK